MVSKNTLQFCNTGKDQVGRHILHRQFFANFSTMSRDNALICYTLKILCKLSFSNNKNYITHRAETSSERAVNNSRLMIKQS